MLADEENFWEVKNVPRPSKVIGVVFYAERLPLSRKREREKEAYSCASLTDMCSDNPSRN